MQGLLNNSVRVYLIKLKIGMLYHRNNTFRNTVFQISANVPLTYSINLLNKITLLNTCSVILQDIAAEINYIFIDAQRQYHTIDAQRQYHTIDAQQQYHTIDAQRQYHTIDAQRQYHTIDAQQQYHTIDAQRQYHTKIYYIISSFQFGLLRNFCGQNVVYHPRFRSTSTPRVSESFVFRYIAAVRKKFLQNKNHKSQFCRTKSMELGDEYYQSGIQRVASQEPTNFELQAKIQHIVSYESKRLRIANQ